MADRTFDRRYNLFFRKVCFSFFNVVSVDPDFLSCDGEEIHNVIFEGFKRLWYVEMCYDMIVEVQRSCRVEFGDSCCDEGPYCLDLFA